MDNILMMDKKVLRYAVYVRGADTVSSQEQLLQKYRDSIRERRRADPDSFSFVRFYSDERNGNQELQRLIEDCESGKVDIVLACSMLRFCRKITDTLAIVRRLRELPSPVGIWFDQDEIFTLDAEGDLFLKVLVLAAEEESWQKSSRLIARQPVRYNWKKDVKHE